MDLLGVHIVKSVFESSLPEIDTVPRALVTFVVSPEATKASPRCQGLRVRYLVSFFELLEN